MDATAYLKDAGQHETGPLVALPGTERSLKQNVIHAISAIVLGGEEDDDASVSRFAGKDTEWKTVSDELRTVSMWSDQRLVVINDADDFVSANRASLEKYLQKPAKKSVLILDVKSFPKNTRLAKATAKAGLVVECTELKGRELTQWIVDTGRDQYSKHLTRDAAFLLTELAGNHLGLLDQELAKLASYTGERDRVDIEDVRKLVGGWKAETTFVMTNAIRNAQLGLALSCLEKLLVAGEAPQRILGGINYVFRKLAQTTELARQGGSLNAALDQSGVFPRDRASAGQYLRRIGRPRAEKLYQWLLQADTNMKGGSRLSERMQLEQLLMQLSGQFD